MLIVVFWLHHLVWNLFHDSVPGNGCVIGSGNTRAGALPLTTDAGQNDPFMLGDIVVRSNDIPARRAAVAIGNIQAVRGPPTR